MQQERRHDSKRGPWQTRRKWTLSPPFLLPDFGRSFIDANDQLATQTSPDECNDLGRAARRLSGEPSHGSRHCATLPPLNRVSDRDRIYKASGQSSFNWAEVSDWP
jgi:hypothetical protein